MMSKNIYVKNKEKEKDKSENGVTLISLVVTIIVLSIIAGISIYSGKNTIKRAKLEELRTNMLLIETKAKEYIEEVDFRIGPIDKSNNPAEYLRRLNMAKEVYTNAGLVKATGVTIPIDNTKGEVYEVTPDALNKMELNIKLGTDEKYLIQFDETNLKTEIYNTIGFDGKYSLTDIENIEI